MSINQSLDVQTTADGPVEKPSRLPASVWKAAYAVAGATVLAVPLGIEFFTVGGVFGPLSDAWGLLVALLLVPLVRGLSVVNDGLRFDRPAVAIGGAAIAGMGLGSFGLVVRSIIPLVPDTVGGVFLGIQFVGSVLLGVWLLAVGWIGLRDNTVGRRVSWAAVVAGTGMVGGIVTLVYSYAVGSFTPAFPAFMALYFVGFVVWAFLLGGELRARSTR